MVPRTTKPVGDPKPARRVADRKVGILKVQSEARCRACGYRGLSHISRAHLVPKGQRGDDVDANIVPLCGGGTTGCHGSLTDHHPASYPSLYAGRDWKFVASALRGRLTEEEESYVIRKKGLDWLNKHYPYRGQDNKWPS